MKEVFFSNESVRVAAAVAAGARQLGGEHSKYENTAFILHLVVRFPSSLGRNLGVPAWDARADGLLNDVVPMLVQERVIADATY
ncbi:MAG: hypothetical protein JXP73_14200 [Deltaproteobacteria bacterium]|jgi:hypothetical protein|nr:hypothetical protein [Deltaproteobacteria bacterium]